MQKLYLIDANSLIHRAYHALPKTFTAQDGSPTNALYGLSSILLKLLREEKPDYAAAAFDRPEPTFRKKEYKEYKAQRPTAPDELISQIIKSRELFGQFGIRVFEAPGFEADDIIATLAERFGKEKDLQVVILTGDRDTLQLVKKEKIIVKAPKKGISELTTYDEHQVKEQYGLRPNQLIDYKAMVGDPSDNIKGVPGIGPKSAVDILFRYETLEAALKSAGKDPKLSKLLQFEKEALQAKHLVTLRFDAPVTAENLEALFVKSDQKPLEEYFLSMGFMSLVKRMNGAPGGEAPKKKTPAKPASSQGSLL